jgi:hypothetical protein
LLKKNNIGFSENSFIIETINVKKRKGIKRGKLDLPARGTMPAFGGM